MALAIDASSPAAVSNQTSSGVTTLTTASFTPPSGALILACATGNPGSKGETITFTNPTGSFTSWTSVISYNNMQSWTDDGGVVAIAYAFANSSSASSVRATFSYQNDCELKVYVLTGAKNPGPINTAATLTVSANTTTPFSYQSTSSGSQGFIVMQNPSSNGTLSISSATTDVSISTYSHGLIAHQTTQSSANNQTQSFSTTNSSSDYFALGYVEVVPTTAPSGGFSGGGTGTGGTGGGSLVPNTLTLKINGVDRTQYWEQDQWQIQQSWGRQADSATIKVWDEYTGSQPTFVPQATQTVEIKDTTLGIVLFGGIIVKPELDAIGPGVNEWILNCSSYTFWADARIVSYSYVNMSMGAIIRDLTTNASCGITTNNVVTGPSITSVQGYFEPLSKAWSKITQMASTQTTYGWWVDGSGDLHVWDETTAQSSGVSFTDRPTTSHLNAEGHYQNTNLKYTWDAAQLANRIYVVGGNVPTQQSDSWTGDGRTRSFALRYPLDTGSQIQPALKVGGATTVVSTQNTDPWYLSQDQTTGLWTLVASSTTNTPTPASSVAINLTYGYLVTQVSIVQNTTSITKYNGGNGGYFDATVADQSLLTLTQTNQRGQHEVAEYGYGQEQLQFDTSEDWQGWVSVGQTIVFSSATTPDSGNSYQIPLTSKTFLVVNLQAQSVEAFRKCTIQAIRVS